MNTPYDLHSWSTQYREEVLHEVRMTRLEGRLREDRKVAFRTGLRESRLGKRAVAGARSVAPGLADRPKERTRNERLIFGIETRLPNLSPVRGEQTLPFGSGLDALPSRVVPTYRGLCSKLCGAYPPCQTLSVATPASAAILRCGTCPTGRTTALRAARRCSRSTFARPVRSPRSTAKRTGRAGWTAASGREAASWTTRTWRSGRTHRTGLTYYRGHRAGSEARQSRNHRNPDTREKLFG